ncbi:hypothetical protein L3Q82_000276 [Scortum barcoo]|uniref:Uncharacterized protein n=1 Tax=Scortum barcoo TaxID=214431 RepID=A0ACB8X9R2_9TELE|nr:hypothetical protein L3Q82_000276 [Scortum barcoo]
MLIISHTYTSTYTNVRDYVSACASGQDWVSCGHRPVSGQIEGWLDRTSSKSERSDLIKQGQGKGEGFGVDWGVTSSNVDRQEYEVRGARPRRHIRPPARYADYEVEHLGYSGQRYREDVEVPQKEGRAKMTPLTSAYDSSPPSRLQRRDAIPQDMDLCHGAEGQQHIQENQLAPLLSPESELREQDGNRFTPLHPTLCPRPPPEDIKAELEDIRHERRLLQWTQQRIASDLAELRTLRADMRKLVDAVQNLPSPSTPHTSKPELVLPPPLAEPDGVEEDDWPAPPPWPDPAIEMLLPDKPPHVKEEVVPTPITQPFESQPPGQQSAYDTSHYLRPWLKLVQPLPQPCTLPPPEFGYHTGYSAPKSEPGCNPQQLPSRSWMQPPPSGLFPGRNSSVTESGYYGPRPSIRNFSRRDPSEFARLKLSLENLLPPEATELFKYQVLVDHLQLEEAQLLIADAYLNSPTPFSDTMAALNDRFGQPHQIALRRIAAVMDAPDIRRGDIAAFEKFALQVQSLVGMLTLGSEGEAELKCGSHVARLLSKLPPEQRAEFRRCMFHRGTQTHTLPDLSEWLKYESWCQDSEGQLALRGPREKPAPRPEGRQSNRPITVPHGGKDADEMPEVRASR